ncbi:MAG: hypothetical protein Q8O31_00565 [Rhodocyclaceae bacterium]|nr:hypothetical protein [Rhodocyclaceae bacterium]
MTFRQSNVTQSPPVQGRKERGQVLTPSFFGTVDRLIAEEQRHLQAAKTADEARLNLRLSVEDRIRELSRKVMDEESAHQDRLRQIDEKQALARAALAAQFALMVTAVRGDGNEVKALLKELNWQV